MKGWPGLDCQFAATGSASRPPCGPATFLTWLWTHLARFPAER